MSLIPAIQEVEVGGSWSEASPGKVIGIPYPKNKLKAKELGTWFL
jgi:hypothetical protein